MQYYFKWITHWKRNNKSNPFAIKHTQASLRFWVFPSLGASWTSKRSHQTWLRFWVFWGHCFIFFGLGLLHEVAGKSCRDRRWWRWRHRWRRVGLDSEPVTVDVVFHLRRVVRHNGWRNKDKFGTMLCKFLKIKFVCIMYLVLELKP